MGSSPIVKREGRLWQVGRPLMEFWRISALITSVFSVMCELWSSAERKDGGEEVLNFKDRR